MNKSIFTLLTFLIAGGIAFFVQRASAQNAAPSGDTLQATLITDSAKKLYVLRKQRSIKRFGPRCQVNENGLPKYCDDVEALNHGITATIDTEIAWQFFDLNKDALDIIDPRAELKLDIVDLLEYPAKLDSIPPPRSPGETWSDYQWRMQNKIRYEEKAKVGECLDFSQLFKGNAVAESEILLSIDTLGIIRGFNYKFYPEARGIDLASYINEEEARKIAVEDTTIDPLIKSDRQFNDWMNFVNDSMPELSKYLGKFICFPIEKYISCGIDGCDIYYRTSICAIQSAYTILIDGKNGTVKYLGLVL